MNLLETSVLLNYVKLFDNREVLDEQVEAWHSAVTRRLELRTAKLAVELFFDHPATAFEYPGRVFFDTRELRFWYAKAREQMETEANRARARLSPAQRAALEAGHPEANRAAEAHYAPPAGWRDQVQASLKQVPDAQ